jgi:hypothetical protein
MYYEKDDASLDDESGYFMRTPSICDILCRAHLSYPVVFVRTGVQVRNKWAQSFVSVVSFHVGVRTIHHYPKTANVALCLQLSLITKYPPPISKEGWSRTALSII